ncbi:myb/SANT-like DNA-binding domain-containing protein 1 [Ornithodoros turicata]|uniref:myb/SANT-like DNA-binding domain-containing protein 1 n=1 Tax=Ornithodoros turicata TaxID=34597 RepID=UPI003139D707
MAELKKDRTSWTEQETFALIRTWEDHLADLRRTKRNAKVYADIADALQAQDVSKSVKEVKKKIENLANKYRSLCRTRTTGSGSITWKFYWDLHRFLGTLSANDISLTEESVAVPSPEQLFLDMVGASGSKDGLEDDDVAPVAAASAEEPSQCSSGSPELCGGNSPSRATPPPPQKTRKKRQAAQSTLLAQLLEEQRQLRYALEQSRAKELELSERQLAIRERQLELQERAAQREEALINVLTEALQK